MIKILINSLLLFSIAEICLAQTNRFPHAYGSYLNSDTQFGKQAVFQSRNDTKASATMICRKGKLNSVATEYYGTWQDLPENRFNYTGSYWCAPLDKNLKRLSLQVVFLNNLQCAWKGEAYSNILADTECEREFGTGINGKVFGGCIGGYASNVYVFETYCR